MAHFLAPELVRQVIILEWPNCDVQGEVVISLPPAFRGVYHTYIVYNCIPFTPGKYTWSDTRKYCGSKDSF